jgi:tetratricopeptide (TPR) repeat protein
MIMTLRTSTLSTLAFALSVSAAAEAADVCIGPEASKKLSTCPGGDAASFQAAAAGKKPKAQFHSAPPPVEAKKRQDAGPPVGTPSEQMTAGQRDERTSRLKSRARAMLTTEIAGIESLLGRTPKGAADRPQIVRRLAESYVELEAAAFREKTQAEVDRDDAKKAGDAAKASKKQGEADGAKRVLEIARRKAIEHYTVLKTDYANYPQLDEVLYYLAYEYEQGNENDEARRVYLELVKSRPNSKYVPNAYLAFGELFFNEAVGDPGKWTLAEQAYKKVIEYKPEQGNKVYGYAWYKLAYVYWNNLRYAEALNAFKKTIDYGVAFAQMPNATKLAESARKDIVPLYAVSGKPEAAFAFFKGVSGDEGGSSTRSIKMLGDLGQNYLDTGHYKEAQVLYKELLKVDPGSALTCVYQTHITEAVMAANPANKPLIVGELDVQLKAHDVFARTGADAKAKFECSNRTAELVAETAMAWHLEAVGSDGQRGTGDTKTMAFASQLYNKAIDTFKPSEFEKFEFPKLVREDWPTIYKLKYNVADLLYFQQNWAECGPAFDRVVDEDPTSPEAAEAAFAAVLCYQKTYALTHEKGSDRKGTGNLPGQKAKEEKSSKKAKAEVDESTKFASKPFNDGQKSMVNAFDRYVCYVNPEKKDAAAVSQLVEVKFARARVYFETQNWEEAALAFRDIALNHADSDAGVYAAQLYLESINVVGEHSKPPRPSCFDDMASDVPKFIDLYCSADKYAKNQEQCDILTRIQCDIRRMKAQKQNELAGSYPEGSPERLRMFEDAARTYLDLWRTYGEPNLAQGKPSQCEKIEEIVYNSAESFQAAKLVANAIQVRRILLDPRFGLAGTEIAKESIRKLGGNYQAIAVYDTAADYYEKYASNKGKESEKALSDAVILRLGLGDDEKAVADAKEFQSRFGSSKPAQAAAIAFALGARYADREEWDKAKSTLSASMANIDKGPIDVRVQAHATLGKAYRKLAKPKLVERTIVKIVGRKEKRTTEMVAVEVLDASAKKEYATVRELWGQGNAGMAKIDEAYKDEPEAARRKRLAKALTAVGEAYFYVAEENKQAQVDTLKFPEYKGPGKKDDVMKHINTKVVDWYKKKSEAIAKVSADYKKILELQPEPPPKWVIAAGSRVGLMWGDFVDDFRRAPYPKEWDQKGCAAACGTLQEVTWDEVRARYFDSLDGASEPFKANNAKPALKTCLDYSVKYQYFDEYSRACEVWLSDKYKSEYHVIDEIKGAPNRIGRGLDDKMPPVLVGGTLSLATGASKAPEATDSSKEEE